MLLQRSYYYYCYLDVLFMYTSIHGFIEIDISSIGYRDPCARHSRHVLFRYLWHSVLDPLVRSIQMTNSVCDSERIDCFSQNINAFRMNVMKILK